MDSANRGYFYEMACVIQECARIMKPNAPLIMVNDNVRYAGVSISVDIILSEFAEALGFEMDSILVLPTGKGNSSQQMGLHGREPLRKCVYIWKKKEVADVEAIQEISSFPTIYKRHTKPYVQVSLPSRWKSGAQSLRCTGQSVKTAPRRQKPKDLLRLMDIRPSRRRRFDKAAQHLQEQDKRRPSPA